MSPSFIVYSFPSIRIRPFSLAFTMLPHSIKSSYDTISAFINPLSISECIFPAACGAFVPFLIVHALTSTYPAVKYDINPKI